MAFWIRNWDRVLVGKIDLDTIGVAFLLGIIREDKVEVVRGLASESDLAYPWTLCIEVGGSGRVEESNFDHHEVGGPDDTATMQAWQAVTGNGQGNFLSHLRSKYRRWLWDNRAFSAIEVLVDYINTFETKGPRALPSYGRVEFPTLSDVLAGMLLTERNPVEQLHKGIEIFETVVISWQNPAGTIRGFDFYAEAKAENNRQRAKAVETARWGTTSQGHKLAHLETDFFGAPGALYGNGAKVVVAFSPRFGNPPVPKFTVAGNGIKVDAVLPELNALEQGWGGSSTGTILGSPRSGSKLTLEQVVEIVRRTL